MRTKNFKNYISILVFVNYRNRLDASPPLMFALDISNVPEKFISVQLCICFLQTEANFLSFAELFYLLTASSSAAPTLQIT